MGASLFLGAGAIVLALVFLLFFQALVRVPNRKAKRRLFIEN